MAAADVADLSLIRATKPKEHGYHLKHEPLAKFIDRVILPPLEGASLSPSVKPEPA
jgi:hypothetical protein